jgi:hypothetical protein
VQAIARVASVQKRLGMAGLPGLSNQPAPCHLTSEEHFFQGRILHSDVLQMVKLRDKSHLSFPLELKFQNNI